VRPYLLAILAGYSAGMLSSARCFVNTTYLVLGLVVAYTQLSTAAASLPSFWVSRRLALRVTLISLVVLAVIQVYVWYFIQLDK
jgi:hypothetical protein